MNNRQAGAYRELVRKEERAREKWNELHGHQLQQTQSVPNGQPGNTLAQYGGQTFQPQRSFQPQQTQAQQTNGGYPASFQASPSFAPAATNGPASTLPLAPSAIYDQAIRISSPRLQDSDDVNIPSTVQRRVVRQVEVPFTRQVKVPVMTRQLVPVLVEKKVKVKKLVEQPSTKLVNEEYTEVIQQPAIRNKEIWIKKLVPERFSQPITIKKTRQVAVPTTVLKEVDDWEVVQVTENRAVEVPGYRIDEVQDSKLVEVEELQNYSLQPLSTGSAQVLSARDVGPIAGFHHSRRIGTEVFHPQDQRHAAIEEDSLPYSGTNQRPLTGSGLRNTFARNGANISGSISARANGATRATNGAAPAGSSTQRSDFSSTTTAEQDKSIGFKVRDGDANGVVVYRVTPGEAAERAGVRQGDIVVYLNNRPTRNLAEFRSVLSSSSGPVLLQVRRRGVQKLSLTVHR